MLPLARVFAASARAAAPLAELLAQHGYRIQVVNPDEQPAPGSKEPCALEINIEQLPPAEAEQRAHYLAERLGCDVLVASAALAGLRAVEAEPAPHIAGSVLAAAAGSEVHAGVISAARYSRERDWQMAVAGAALMATVIMFALGFFGNSAQSSNRVSKALVQPAAKIIGPAVVSASTITPHAPTKAQPPLAAKPAKPRPAQASTMPANDDSDDVIVRYYAPAKAQPRTQIKTVAGLKHYSDLQ